MEYVLIKDNYSVKLIPSISRVYSAELFLIFLAHFCSIRVAIPWQTNIKIIAKNKWVCN